MAEAAQDAGFTDEEVCNQAKGNAGAMPLVLLAYAREQGQPLEEAARFAGQVFAPGWDAAQGKGALVAARSVALNMASGGAEVRRLAGDDRRAEATVAGWPSEEDLSFFGLTRDEADVIYGVFGPIAEHLGLRYEWRREGDAVALAFAQTGQA